MSADTGYAFGLGACFECGQPFTFNLELVPSIRVRGTKEPICRACVERANPIRVANGLDPIEILDGAYEPGPMP